jgi:hypothetical protein
LDIDESSFDMREITKILSFTENKILPEDVPFFLFMESPAFQRAAATFSQYNDNADLLALDYVTMRNFLITNILIDNAQRAGALLNLKFRHIAHAEEVGGNYVLTVSYY